MGADQYCDATQLSYDLDISIGPKYLFSNTTIHLTFRVAYYCFYLSRFESKKSRFAALKEYSEVDTIIYLAILPKYSLRINLEMND